MSDGYDPTGVSHDPDAFAGWLRLREAADAAARAADLLEPLRRPPTGGGPTVVHDLGAGTGSMVRWLAPGCPARSTGSCTTATPSCSAAPTPGWPPPTAPRSPWRPGGPTSPG
ncbi:hypothetical protein JD77_05387 [Micromonospora olivasterospora]|uniref:Methyltransferase family protein n=1 Tax=Micromonospora olivasterospora TaxID=1880 RepID=A0A562IHJ0_MICOL|nr:hypothetical protein JD77_05387 [Micromonospora olivasterospora]